MELVREHLEVTGVERFFHDLASIVDRLLIDRPRFAVLDEPIQVKRCRASRLGRVRPCRQECRARAA